MADRTTTVTWRGNLLSGEGTMNSLSNALRGTVDITVEAELG